MNDFKYIIMAGGTYDKWNGEIKHLVKIKGEPLVARTIRLLRECGIEDISISTNHPGFENMGVPILTHTNEYRLGVDQDYGNWLDAFYPITEPTCFMFGDVVFSSEAVRKIVETDVDDIMFFASAPPFADTYTKPWAEPFAYKVVDIPLFFESIEKAKIHEKEGRFYRKPVSWELWQEIKGTPLGEIDYTNYVAINDYTCDIDEPEDIEKIERFIK